MQSDKRYKYPTFFPFSIAINQLIREGNAQYNERIISGKKYFNYNEWNIDTINKKVYANDVYYPLYVMLMISLPKEFRGNWSNGKFDVTLFSDKLYTSYVDLFAIMSLLANDIIIYDFESTYDEIKFCQNEFIARKEEVEKKYIKQCQEFERNQAKLVDEIEKKIKTLFYEKNIENICKKNVRDGTR